jgi:hypothetical protein
MTPRRNILALGLVFTLPLACYPQGSRPPVDKLSLMRDASISSPTDGQPFAFATADSKWHNTSTLKDIILNSTTIGGGGATADFGLAKLINPTFGDVLNWSSVSGALSVLAPLTDSGGKTAENVSSRQLIGTDGTTVRFDWSGSSPKFPALANSNALAFLQADASGNVSVVSLPNAGTIPATVNLLAGDGAGNAIDTGFVPWFGGGFKFEPSAPSNEVGFAVRNSSSSGHGRIAVGNDLGMGSLTFYSFGSTETGLTIPIAVSGDSALEAGFGRLIIAASGPIIGSNDTGTTERWRFGNGLAVGTTIDPGGSVVNVGSTGGYRISNTAPQYHSLVGNGTSYVDGSVPGKVAVTSTVDQTATTETAHVTYTVPANAVSAGTTFRIAAWGNTDSGTSIGFTPRLRWGGTAGTALLTGTNFTTGSAQTNKDWKLEGYVTIRTAGATGTAVSTMGWESYNSGSYVSNMNTSGITAVTIDTTASKDLVLTFVLSATTGTPHVRTIGGTIEVVKP